MNKIPSSSNPTLNNNLAMTAGTNSTEQKNFLDLPEELLIHIFSMILPGQNRYSFSLVCDRLYQISSAHMSPVDFLIVEKYKNIVFHQKNRISTFLTFDTAKNQSEIVITGDREKYNENPMVSLWESEKSPVNESHLIKPFFYKPITMLSKGGQLDNFLAAATYYGQIQIWDIKERIKILDMEIGKEITCVCGNKDQLMIGFRDGTMQIRELPHLTKSKTWKVSVSDSLVNKIFVHSSTQRIFTLFTLSDWRKRVKILDAKSGKCIKEFNDINGTAFNYDAKSQFLICGSGNRSITLRRAIDGFEIATFTDSDKTADLTAAHLDAESGFLFAAFEISMLCEDGTHLGRRTKMAIWDIKTKQLFTSFLLHEPGHWDLSISHIDFDPKSRLILTGGYHVCLWQLDGTLVKKLTLPENRDFREKVTWEKEAQRLFVLADGQLHLFDYSRKPFEIKT